MTIDAFWKLIEGIDPASFDMKAKNARLASAQATLPPEELRAFADHYWACRRRAFTWPLWDAAAIMHGGCGDDAFMDFRSSLITFGRDVFERALADPDSLADLPQQVPRDQGVYATIHTALARLPGPSYQPTGTAEDEPEGVSIEQEEAYEELAARRFPRLSARLEEKPKYSIPPRRSGWITLFHLMTYGVFDRKRPL